MARSICSCLVFTFLMFLTMESSFIGTAQAMSSGNALLALAPKAAGASPFSSLFKANLPAEAHGFIDAVKNKISEDPSILSQPASWENLVSFVELASSKAKHTAKYAKKSPVQKIVHHLLEEHGDEADNSDDQDVETPIDKLADNKALPANTTSPVGMVIFFVLTLVLVGGLRYLALFLTQRGTAANVDPIDYMIGTNFTMGSMIAGMVAGFSFSFVDSIALVAVMTFFESLLTKLPGANEQSNYAAYANIISNLISGAISTTAGAVVSQAMSADSQRVPFWSQLAGALVGGVLGVLVAKIIPRKNRLRDPEPAVAAEEAADE